MRGQQALDREERVAWRDARSFMQKTKRGQMRSGWQKYKQRQKKKRADELQAEEKKRADEIKIQIAKVEAAKEQAKIEAAKEQAKIDKELKIKEMELQAQAQASTNLWPLLPLKIKMPSPRSYHPL